MRPLALGRTHAAMLTLFGALRGASVEALDGVLGSVEDVLVDDRSWAVRHVVVTTGRWLSRRTAVIPRDALGPADPPSHRVRVELAAREVRQAPLLDLHPPRSRQRQLAFLDDYGRWLPWRRRPGHSPLETQTGGDEPPDEAQEDLEHRRSAHELAGYRIEAADRTSGFVGDVVVDVQRWVVPYLAVVGRVVPPAGRVLLVSDAVREIDLVRRRVHVSLAAGQIEAGPECDEVEGAVSDPRA